MPCHRPLHRYAALHKVDTESICPNASPSKKSVTRSIQFVVPGDAWLSRSTTSLNNFTISYIKEYGASVSHRIPIVGPGDDAEQRLRYYTGDASREDIRNGYLSLKKERGGGKMKEAEEGIRKWRFKRAN